MTAFHEVSFPLSVALGARGGPQRRTEIVTLASGHEERNSPWASSRRRWNAGGGVKTLDDMAELLAFFEARRGPLHGFRFRDPFDFTSSSPSASVSAVDQPLGTGDGQTTVYGLIKRYQSGLQSVDRRITKPKAGSVVIGLDGAPLVEGGDYTVDVATGLVTFVSAPGAGAVLTAGFEFDTPVRFDSDSLDLTLEAFGAGEAADIPLIEILV